MKATPAHGSFLRLLQHHGVAPQAVPMVKGAPTKEHLAAHGTTVIAVKFKDGVLNVSDRRATANNVILFDEADKVMALDDFTLISIAGAYASAVEAVRFLKHAFRYYARSQLQELSLEGKLAEVSRVLSSSLAGALQGIGGFIPILSAYDRKTGTGRIFFYDIMGARFETREYGAAGSGSVQIKGALEYVVRERGPFRQMTLKKALRELFVLLDVAAGLDAATGGLAGLMPVAKVVTAEGVTPVDDGLRREAFEAAIATRAALEE